MEVKGSVKFQLRLISIGAGVYPNQTRAYLHSSGMLNQDRHIQQLAESTTHLLPDLQSEGYFGMDGKMDTIRIASIQKYSKPKALHIPEWDFRDLQHHQGLQTCRSDDLLHTPIKVAYLACAEDRWSWRMTVYLHQLDQVVISISGAVPMQFHCLSKLLLAPSMDHSLVVVKVLA